MICVCIYIVGAPQDYDPHSDERDAIEKLMQVHGLYIYIYIYIYIHNTYIYIYIYI